MLVGKKIEDLQREKIFMPFDALKGFREALHEKERHFDKKIDLSEEKQMEISQILRNLKKHDVVKVSYFIDNRYQLIQGEVASIVLPYKYIVVDNTRIGFDDIGEIEILNH